MLGENAPVNDPVAAELNDPKAVSDEDEFHDANDQPEEQKKQE